MTAVEKRTGKSKHVTISNALKPKSEAEIEAGRKRIQDLYESRADMVDQAWDTNADLEEELVDSGAAVVAAVEGRPSSPLHRSTQAGRDREMDDLLNRLRRLLGTMHEEDREEAIELNARLESAAANGDAAEVKQATKALKELLFFVEGQGVR